MQCRWTDIPDREWSDHVTIQGRPSLKVELLGNYRVVMADGMGVYSGDWGAEEGVERAREGQDD